MLPQGLPPATKCGKRIACYSDRSEGTFAARGWLRNGRPSGRLFSFQHLFGVPPTVPLSHKQPSFHRPRLIEPPIRCLPHFWSFVKRRLDKVP